MLRFTGRRKTVRLGILLALIQFLLQVNVSPLSIPLAPDHNTYFVSAPMPLADCLRIESAQKPYQALGQREWSVAETVIPSPGAGSRPHNIPSPQYRNLLNHHTASHLRI